MVAVWVGNGAEEKGVKIKKGVSTEDTDVYGRIPWPQDSQIHSL